VLLLLSTAQQDQHKQKKVAIDGWDHLLKTITINNRCVGMGCIALLFDSFIRRPSLTLFKKSGPTFQSFINPDILAEGAIENWAHAHHLKIILMDIALHKLVGDAKLVEQVFIL
jgi:hypothetical protein